MNNSIMYHDGNRRLQDQFNSRRISDRLEEKLTHSQFTEGDKTIVEGAAYFFLATADAESRQSWSCWRSSSPRCVPDHQTSNALSQTLHH
jgi:hypothetical protein